MQAQARRAERSEILAGMVVYPWLETPHGPQEEPSLVLDVLPGWLMGVDTRRIQGEAHDTILSYQREAFAVLYRHFAERSYVTLIPDTATTGSNGQLAGQVAQISEQIEVLSGTLNFMHEHLTALLTLPGQIADLVERQDQTMAFLTTLAERQDQTEAGLTAVDNRTQRLTPAHTRAVQEYVDRLVRETKNLQFPLSYVIIYGRIKHRFRVGSYKEVADSRFEEVMRFLQDELSQATRGQSPQQTSLF